ncbi:MAG: HNH endonuclease signature motif containing protein [Candidatus Zeuxoniibacter abyssi]|nr:MAG: HNH endonuclease signature motif containing protein [Candidatus Persebacteraceae bacterium AB1(2)]
MANRYKGNPIGNASNALVRNILSNLGNERFNSADWTETKKYFKNCCAYCGKEQNPKDLVMEHAIPINKEVLGEHRLGNIVPSCKQCNSEKHKKSFEEFLGDDTQKINAIKKCMSDKITCH